MGTRPLGRMLPCQKEEAEDAAVPVALSSLRETYCQEHCEKVHFFCLTDTELLCEFCMEDPAHKAHVVGFLEDTIRPYRDRLRSQLEALNVERDKIDNVRCREGQKLQELLDHMERKKQQVDTVFEWLQQKLESQRHNLLARLKDLEKQIWKERAEYIRKVSTEVTRVGAQVERLKAKCQQPGSELVQDIRANQSRCEMKTFVNPEAISSDLAKKILELHRKILVLPKMMETLYENVLHHLEMDSSNYQAPHGYDSGRVIKPLLGAERL